VNLLAHSVLSPKNERIRVGNVLADFIGRREKEGLDPEIQEGIELHQRIDRFTDNHPVVQRSQAKLVGFQRYANPLIDVFYDHFLTVQWPKDQFIGDYIEELYDSIRACHPILPADCGRISETMMEQNWLAGYGSYPGLETNLGRMERRIEYVRGRKVDLVSAIQILEVRYKEFEADFLEFWPQLVVEVS